MERKMGDSKIADKKVKKNISVENVFLKKCYNAN
jgi:hypothetical protein